ncbi:transcription termination factor MTERF2, chloroplastic-like isoform X2 [Musa acuminata AAA Group]|uniref:transcription termination factor MTERF2, chloroplastic-like isoform X2 n=1 Tax=Musa acuminata AAA Group TaxID=214697 RepID=UPI0031DB8896
MAWWALPAPTTVVPTLSPSIDRPRSWNVAFVLFLGSNSPSPFVSSVSTSSVRSCGFRATRVRFAAAEDGWCPSSTSGLPAVDEAREAVVEILREFGASQEDSVYIAANSPCYVEMLVGNVQELDELGLWGSWNSEIVEGNVDMSTLSFRKKVYYMAKSKGDKGVLPYLDSIGVKLSSALLIARYLSSEKLPQLIDKVNFVSGILFPSSINKALIGRNARRMMMHLSIPADEDVQSTLSFFEKAGLEEKDIAKMLMKYPWILSTSIQWNYEKILAFFNEKKVPKSSVDLAIRSWPHILGCSATKMKSMVEQFNEFGVKKKMLVPVITSSPQLLLKKPKEFQEVVSFMEEIGFDSKTIGRILCRCPEIFASSVDNTLRKKVNFLADFGVSRDCLLRIVRKYPEMLLLDTDNTLLPRMSFLMRVGLSKREVCSMICRFSPILGYSIEMVLKPKLDFLLRTMKKPLKEIVEYPRYFSYSLDKKIKPRFWVIQSRKLECSLKDMLSKNDDEFAQEYMGIGRLLVVPSVPPKDGS